MRYRNRQQLPRERDGIAANGPTCHHGRALKGEGCPACGAEAGEGIDHTRVERLAVRIPRVFDHPDLTSEQRETFLVLIARYGAPFAMSIVGGSALPVWQNIGTVSIRVDGVAVALSNGERI